MEHYPKRKLLAKPLAEGPTSLTVWELPRKTYPHQMQDANPPKENLTTVSQPWTRPKSFTGAASQYVWKWVYTIENGIKARIIVDFVDKIMWIRKYLAEEAAHYFDGQKRLTTWESWRENWIMHYALKDAGLGTPTGEV